MTAGQNIQHSSILRTVCHRWYRLGLGIFGCCQSCIGSSPLKTHRERTLGRSLSIVAAGRRRLFQAPALDCCCALHRSFGDLERFGIHSIERLAQRKPQHRRSPPKLKTPRCWVRGFPALINSATDLWKWEGSLVYYE
jgi:hypothetical protein